MENSGIPLIVKVNYMRRRKRKPQSKTTVTSNKLRTIRVDEGLDKAELARLSDVSERTIREIENGNQSREETLRRIVNGLNRNPKRKKEYEFEEVFPPDQR